MLRRPKHSKNEVVAPEEEEVSIKQQVPKYRILVQQRNVDSAGSKEGH